ncbi:MAG: DUF6232 family protein [bacterium]
MFCRECGKTIEEDSKFCKHCGIDINKTVKGKKDEEKSARIVIERSETTEKQKGGEVSYYSDEKGVRITNARAIIGTTTYMMANITSVSKKKEPNLIRQWGIFIAILAFLLTIWTLNSNMQSISFLGILILICGVLMAVFSKQVYVVKIGSASGEADAIRSKDESYINGVVSALNEAFVQFKGR